ncbi:MAG: hypothetical protein FGM23_03230 [Alphaproteobacteria bacterium]|nr:hypothetical protein [Alphaproteobacteria bacterium]
MTVNNPVKKFFERPKSGKEEEFIVNYVNNGQQRTNLATPLFQKNSDIPCGLGAVVAAATLISGVVIVTNESNKHLINPAKPSVQDLVTISQTAVAMTAVAITATAAGIGAGASIAALGSIPRKRRQLTGKQAAQNLFAQTITNGIIDPDELLNFMKSFHVAKEIFKGIEDPAAESFLTCGKKYIKEIFYSHYGERSDFSKRFSKSISIYKENLEDDLKGFATENLLNMFKSPDCISDTARSIFKNVLSEPELDECVKILKEFYFWDVVYEEIIQLYENSLKVTEVFDKLGDKFPELAEPVDLLKQLQENLEEKFPEIKDIFIKKIITGDDAVESPILSGEQQFRYDQLYREVVQQAKQNTL